MSGFPIIPGSCRECRWNLKSGAFDSGWYSSLRSKRRTACDGSDEEQEGSQRPYIPHPLAPETLAYISTLGVPRVICRGSESHDSIA